MAIRSMTGFARVRKPLGKGEIVMSAKSVNHRGLDVHFRMPSELDAFESALRAVTKRKVSRGHLQIQVAIVNADETAPAVLNTQLLDAYLAAFREAASSYGLRGEPDLNAALGLPGMFSPVDAEPDPALAAQLAAVLEETLDLLNKFREREGAEIASDLRERAGAIQRSVSEMEDIRTRAVPEFQARLSQRLAELLNGAGIEPQRLAQEVAIMADRSDIAEELTRLKIHAAQLNDLLAKGGEVGKKLDFLLQEMQREANTILSKSSAIGELGLAMTDRGLFVKAEIEKIREQSLNLE